jgi:putative transposase
LWQGRFASYVLDEIHLLACARYIEMNPVRAKLVKDPTHWTWSSAFAHTNSGKDKLDKHRLQKHERTGWPAGNIQFIYGVP